MATENHVKPFEVVVPWEDVQGMMEDTTMIVLMALSTADPELFAVTYWSKEIGELPSWIIDREAA